MFKIVENIFFFDPGTTGSYCELLGIARTTTVLIIHNRFQIHSEENNGENQYWYWTVLQF
jgi:hypothetical protein